MMPTFDCYIPDNRKYAKRMTYFKLFQYPPIKIMTIVTSVFLFLLLAATTFTAVYGGTYAPLFETVALIVLFAVFRIVTYRISISTTKKQMVELSGGKTPEVRFVIDGDRMQMIHANGGVTEVEIGSFKKVYVKKDFLFILSDAKILYPLPKDAFVKGTPQELVNYLAAKGVKIA